MISHTKARAGLVAGIFLLAEFVALPAPAEETATQPEVPSSQVVLDVIGRTLNDRHRDFRSTQGPDDCNTEAVYAATRSALKQYIDNPAANDEALRRYLLGDKAQCNCTRAIIGDNFDTILAYLGLGIHQLPCL